MSVVRTQDHIYGRLFLSENYMCFISDEADECTVILPFREVGALPRTFPLNFFSECPSCATC